MQYIDRRLEIDYQIGRCGLRLLVRVDLLVQAKLLVRQREPRE